MVAGHGVVVVATSVASRLRAPPFLTDIIRLGLDVGGPAHPANRVTAGGTTRVARPVHDAGTLLTRDVTTLVDLHHGERQLALANAAIEEVSFAEIVRLNDRFHWGSEALDLSRSNAYRHASCVQVELLATRFGRDMSDAVLVANRDELVVRLLALADGLRRIGLPKLQSGNCAPVGEGPQRKIGEGRHKGNLTNLTDLYGLGAELLETLVVHPAHKRNGSIINDGAGHRRGEEFRPHCEMSSQMVGLDPLGLAVELDGRLTTESFAQKLFAVGLSEIWIRELLDSISLGQVAPWTTCRNSPALVSAQPGVSIVERSLVIKEDIGEVIACCLHETAEDDIGSGDVRLVADAFLELCDALLQSIELSLKHPIGEEVEHTAGELGGSAGQFVLDVLSQHRVGDHALVHHFRVDVRLLEAVAIQLGVRSCRDGGLGTICLNERQKVGGAGLIRKSIALLDSQALEGVVGGWNSLNHLKVGWV